MVMDIHTNTRYTYNNMTMEEWNLESGELLFEER